MSYNFAPCIEIKFAIPYSSKVCKRFLTSRMLNDAGVCGSAGVRGSGLLYLKKVYISRARSIHGGRSTYTKWPAVKTGTVPNLSSN